MCTPQGIVEKIGCLIIDQAVKKAIKAATYVCHYKANLENLEAEMRTLEDRWAIIKGKVLEAEDRGLEVEDAVSHWLADVDEKKQGVQELVGQRIARENMHCFVCSCPNIKGRYRLGKLAEERTEAVKKLTQDSHFDEIAHCKPPPPELEFPSNENYVIFDSRTPILIKIMDALNDPKVNMIGVHGLGGVGKTRLVEEVRKRMRENGTFKQAPLAAVSKNPNVKDIQSKLAGELFLTLDFAADDKIRARQLWDKFSNGERYLVILDDIWREVDLKAIGIPITDGKTGCKVVLTSRNEGLLKKMKVDRSFQIAELSELEAWALFKKKVGDSAEAPELYRLASKVCQKCKGLPVAINALGAALEGKSVHAWKNALYKLESFMLADIEDIDPSVFASLKVTYDMLHSEVAKSCFLICCLFPEDAQIPIDDLMRHCVARRLLAPTPRTLDDARNAVHTVVDTLKSYSLLSDDEEGNVVRIHDVIRDIGIKIARDEKAFLVEDGICDWPETSENGPPYSVISIRSGNINQLPDELTYAQLHTLIFEYSNYPHLKVPDRFFSGMKKLTVLVFNEICLLSLPSSLAQLANLRMLYLNKCELGDIKILGDLKTKLELLSLRGSDIEVLPREMGQLTRLLLLDLRDCYKLTVIPQGVISKLTKLEELYIPDGFDKWEATTDKQQDTSSNASLDELTSLNDQLITLHIHIPDVILLPTKQLKFENLKRFKISVGSMFEYFENFSGTSILKLEGIPLKDEFMSLVYKAEVLYLQRLEGLKKVLHDRACGEGFLKLKYLKVCLCFDLEYLLAKPKSVSFSNLSELVIQSCGNLRYLFSPSCARGLLQLKRLEIKSCPIEEIIGSDGEEDEDELARKVVFPALEELTIIELPQITQLFDKKLLTEESFRQLKDMYVKGCKLLVNVFLSNMLSWFQNLQSIYVSSCENMKVIISMKREEEYDEAETKDNIIRLCQLRYLSLDNLNNLNSFYSSTCEAQLLFNKQDIFPVLEELHIEGLPNITEIWVLQLLSVQDKAESDEHEKLMNAKELANDDIFVFSKLRNLEIVGMKNLKSLFTNSKISEAQPFFNPQVIFPVLEELYIEELPYITEIWDMQLRSIHNRAESSEREKPMNAKELDDIFVFSKLKYLYIMNMKNLKSFCTNSKISEAQPLFNHQVAFPSLETFSIQDVPNIAEIWEKQPLLVTKNETESFYKLNYIEIKQCDNLVNVIPYYMLPQLQINLQHLVITSCPKVEVIVSKKAKEKEVATKDIIVFQKLSLLRLEGLKNLKSFCAEAQFFFDNKVAFPSLKELNIMDVPNITEIWNNQPLLDPQNKTKSFYKLSYVTITNCGDLVNVFPYYMLPQLQINLLYLVITSCPKVEVIVSKKAKEKEAATKDIIVFQKLKILKFNLLKNLQSFCGEPQFFFDNEVAFPSLEDLTIEDVPNITEIWDSQPLLDPQNKTESFYKLSSIRITNCGNLVNVFPYYMLSKLQINLQNLVITSCPKVEVIVTKKAKEEEVATKDIIVFQKLKILIFYRLKNLQSFCGEAQFFFDNEVAFPSLENLTIEDVPNITEIWDNQPLLDPQNKTKSFYKLSSITISNCGDLVNVFPYYMLPQLQINLQNLEIASCPKVEVIVSKKEKQEEVITKDIIVFRKLKILKFNILENLQSFCGEAQFFFENEVAFPILEDLTIEDVPNITEIWDNQLLLDRQNKTESFCKLSSITITNCGDLVNVFPYYMLPQLQINLQNLVIASCPKVEVIVSKKPSKKEAATKDIIVFQKLKILKFYRLENLQSFCGEAQFFFENEVAFPSLEDLAIVDVPNITEIWDNQPLLDPQNKTESFYKLSSITISNCGDLVNVFPYYMLPQLQINLQNLEIASCPKVEVIVSKKEKQEEVITKDIIVFRKLKILKFNILENLQSFCGEAQFFFENEVAFPILEDLTIEDVPNITEIWDNQLLLDRQNKTESFCKLSSITITNCGDLVNVFPYYMLPQLQINLQNLVIASCPKVEVIVSKKPSEKEAVTKDIIVFQKLMFLILAGLKNLKSFCAEAQLFFDSKDTFPVLKDIYLDENLKIFREGTSSEEECASKGGKG
ncbi:uncharacterized protein LOC130757536 isoform X2 [Actinidia eriantha]|uniref:uncharacterized protein LOC130757536 isoform X2 n=1 Tax=Actinidia eriantha TaxID=165200 RepID=UPI00258B3DFB|nr:uncharacterized protein LOC130757536 isoform X2 [Actinidia eriantha]